MQEALYHGVPMLCLPFILDQKNNANKVKREGAGLRLDWNELNEETLHDAIHRLINDPRSGEAFHCERVRLILVLSL